MRSVSAGRSFLESFGSSFISLTAGIGTGIVAARVLGPSDRGVLAQIFFWAQFLAPIGAISIADAIIIHAKQGSDFKSLVRQAYLLMARMVLFVIPVGMLIIVAAMRKDDVNVIYMSLAFWLVQSIVMSFDQVTTGKLKRDQNFRALSLTSAIMPIIYMILLFPMLLITRNVIIFVIAQSLSIIIIFIIRLKLARLVVQKTPLVSVDARLFSTAISIHGTTIIHLLSSQIDRLVVVQTSTNADIGFYFVAVSLAGPLQSFIGVAVSQIALSKFVDATGVAREFLVLRLLRLSWMVSLLGTVVMAIVAPIVAPLLFGRDFLVSGYVAVALTVATALVPVRFVLREATKSMNDNMSPFYAEINFLAFFICAFLIAYFFLVPYPVVIGLAFGNVASAFVLLRALARHMPSVSLKSWLLPTWSTLDEIVRVAFNAVKG